MLDFIKRLFGQEEPEGTPELTLKEAAALISKGIEDEKKRVVSLLSDQKEELERTKKLVSEKLDALEKAELRNAKIAMKEQQFMEGNRDNFVRLGKYFVNGIGEAPGTEEDLKRFSDDFRGKVSMLRKSTNRNLSVLQHFFKNEAGHIVHAINALEKQIHALSGMHSSSRATNLKELETQVKVLMDRIETAKNTLQEAGRLRKEAKEARLNVDAAIQKIAEHGKSKSMQELKIRRKAYADKQDEIHQLLNGIRAHFAVLDRALRKYEHIALDVNTVRKLLKDPVACSLSDTDKTLKLLDRLMDALEKGKLGLKDKKKDKTILAIRALGTGLKSTRTAHELLEKELSQIAGKLDGHPAADEQKKLEKELRSVELAHERGEQKLKQLEEPISETQIEKMLKLIEGQFSEHVKIAKLKK